MPFVSCTTAEGLPPLTQTRCRSYTRGPEQASINEATLSRDMAHPSTLLPRPVLGTLIRSTHVMGSTAAGGSSVPFS